MESQTLSYREIRAAAEWKKDFYPFDTTCAMCGSTWGSHLGLLCPMGSEQERAKQLFDLIAKGNIGPEAWQREFKWAGTMFVPLLDTSENGKVIFDLALTKHAWTEPCPSRVANGPCPGHPPSNPSLGKMNENGSCNN